MTNNWFECKAKYVKIDESGKEKKVSEPYLVDAVSFTEAEARIHKELETMIQGEFTVTNISKSNITEIFPYDDADRWFKVKVSFINVDEESGKEKKANNYMLVGACNVKQAYERIEESLSSWLVPFEMPSIAESPLMDVFPYFKDEEVNEEIPENLKPISEIDANSQDFE
ncbi:MAG: DUF4494 domain-containing protein [Marinifilaceae bacterium]|jgi:hypothetical protein